MRAPGDFFARRSCSPAGSRANENARNRSPWRLHIVIIAGQLVVASTGLRRRPTSPALVGDRVLRRGLRLISASQRALNPFGSSPAANARLAPCAAHSGFDRLATLRLAPSGPSSGPGLLIALGLRRCRSFSSRHGGERLACARGSVLRAARLATLGLAPSGPSSGWACGGLPASRGPCIAGQAVDEYSQSAFPPPPELRQRLTLRLSPASFPLAVPALSTSGSRLPLRFLAWLAAFAPAHTGRLPGPTNPAIQNRIPAGSSVGQTMRPVNLWIQVQISESSVDITIVSAM